MGVTSRLCPASCHLQFDTVLASFPGPLFIACSTGKKAVFFFFRSLAKGASTVLQVIESWAGASEKSSGESGVIFDQHKS